MGKQPSDDCLRKGGLPEISIVDDGGKSCDPQILQKLCFGLEKQFGLKPVYNSPYNGGFIAKHYGTDYRKKGYLGRSVIQLEFARYLYMKESTQEIFPEKTKMIVHGMQQVLQNLF